MRVDSSFFLIFCPKLKQRLYDSDFKMELQFQEEESEGFMYPLSEAEARRRFGDKLHVASLGAIEKDDGSVRVIFDGAHRFR